MERSSKGGYFIIIAWKKQIVISLSRILILSDQSVLFLFLFLFSIKLSFNEESTGEEEERQKEEQNFLY